MAESNHQEPFNGRVPTFWILAACGFLVVAVGIVFGQTAHHQLLGYDDIIYIYETP